MSKTFNRSRFAAALAAHRAARLLTYRAAADESGVNMQVLHAIENGDKTPAVETLGRVCGWMDRDIADFFDEEMEAVLMDPSALADTP